MSYKMEQTVQNKTYHRNAFQNKGRFHVFTDLVALGKSVELAFRSQYVHLVVYAFNKGEERKTAGIAKRR